MAVLGLFLFFLAIGFPEIREDASYPSPERRLKEGVRTLTAGLRPGSEPLLPALAPYPQPPYPGRHRQAWRPKGFHFRLAAGTTSSRVGGNWNNHSPNTPRCSHTPRRARVPGPLGAREPTPRAPSPPLPGASSAAATEATSSSSSPPLLLLLSLPPPPLLLCLLSPLVLLPPPVPASPPIPGASSLAAKGRTLGSGSPALRRRRGWNRSVWGALLRGAGAPVAPRTAVRARADGRVDYFPVSGFFL